MYLIQVGEQFALPTSIKKGFQNFVKLSTLLVRGKNVKTIQESILISFSF